MSPDCVFDRRIFDPLIFHVCPDMKWICCPKCGEITDLHRVGSVGELRVKANQKLTCTHSKKVKCGFCGTTFITSGATIWEVFGRDGRDETCF